MFTPYSAYATLVSLADSVSEDVAQVLADEQAANRAEHLKALASALVAVRRGYVLTDREEEALAQDKFDRDVETYGFSA